MDSMFERNNKVSSAPNQPDSVNPTECNGLILSTSTGSDEVSKVPPLVALQQQHEDLLANGDISEPKNTISKSCTNANNGGAGSDGGSGGVTATGANNNKNNQSKCVVSTESSNTINSTDFSPGDIKVEPNSVRTSESVSSSNGLLTNGNDNALGGVDGLEGALKSGKLF